MPQVDGASDTNTRPTVTWSTTTPIAGAVALFEIHMGIARWKVIALPSPGVVKFPELPADLWTATAPALYSIAEFESADVTSYAANNLATLLLTFPAAGKQVRITTQRSSTTYVPPTARVPHWSPLPSRW